MKVTPSKARVEMSSTGKATFWAKWLTAIVRYIITGAVGAAAVGIVAHWVEARHSTALQHVTDQIDKLYQPFYFASRENDLMWCAFVDEVGSAFSHPSSPTTRTEAPPLAGEGHEALKGAVGAPKPREATG